MDLPSVPVRGAVFLVFNVENHCQELSELSGDSCSPLVLSGALFLLVPKIFEMGFGETSILLKNHVKGVYYT
jgi:hypothetical protein